MMEDTRSPGRVEPALEHDAGRDLRRAEEADASEEKARAAATSLTGRNGRLDQIDADLGSLKSDVATLKADVATLKGDVATLKGDVATLKTDVAVIRAELALMKWMHGITIGGVLALIIKAFFG